jgi:protein-L-isoaspartate(D-aspartate) O-methyltransferase
LTYAKRFWPAVLLMAVVCGSKGPALGGPPDYAVERGAMVERLSANGVSSQRVLAAMRAVHRDVFVPKSESARCYQEVPISLPRGQLLVPPEVVARCLDALDLRPSSKVLQVGAGCGYCTAVLAHIAGRVYTVDPRPHVLNAARDRVQSLGYTSVVWQNGHGCRGWKEDAPYDAIVVTCSTDAVPRELFDTLKVGGRLVIAIGRGPEQTINCLEKQPLPEGGTKQVAKVVMIARIPRMACKAEKQ